jgi:branched-chain amino acid transport system substrate-binding protein
MTRAFRGRRTTVAAALVATAAVVLAGCGGGEQAAAGAGGRPAEFAIDFVLDQTGVAQTFTGAVRQGWDLRVDEANAASEVEGVTLSTRLHDSQSDPRVGAGVMTEVAGSDAPIAAFGTGSNVAPAVAPIAQREGLPLVTIYSGSPGVVDAGDQIFRVTAPQATYHQIQSTYFADQGVERVAIIYNTDNGTLKNLAEEFYPAAAQRDGYEIVQSSGVSVQATDISAEMTGVLASQPDAVLMLVLSQQNTSVVTQLRRANFPGIIAAQPGIGRQALETLGGEADGVVYPIDFSPATEAATGQAFVEAYTARYGDTPDTFAASGYDGASMVIEALKTATSFDRETLHQALLDVSTRGFDGAAGPVRFEERDARVDGIMVRWEGGTETLLAG